MVDQPQQPSSYFEKVANEILQASEHLTTRFEEGLSALWTPPPPGEDSGASQQHHQQQHAFDDEDLTQDQEFLESLSEEELQELLQAQEDMMNMNSPLEGIADSVIGDIMKGSAQNGPQTFWEHVQAFAAAIRWTEPFILGLLVFHMVMFMLVIWASRPYRSTGARIAVLLVFGVLVRSSEYINRWGSQEWEQFATQNYFDARGFFMATMVCAPLLLDCLLMLLLFLREASQLLVAVKKTEMQNKKKQQGENTQSSSTSSSGRSKKHKSKKND